MKAWHPFRDAAMFVVGTWGVIHETLSHQQPRLQLLVLYGAMMGLPAFIGWDVRKKNGKDGQ